MVGGDQKSAQNTMDKFEPKWVVGQIWLLRTITQKLSCQGLANPSAGLQGNW